MKKILVIEDEKNIRENIKLLLELNDFKVFEAGDADEAIKLALAVNPDLIISDIMLPGKDGFYIKEILAGYDSVVHVPFIFLSAKSGIADIRKGMNLGADDYITKPFKSKELLEAIEIRLGRFEQLRGKKKVSIKRQLSIQDKILIHSGKNPLFINIASVVYISAKREYSNLFIDDGRKFLIRKLIKEWELELPANEFLRIHRSYIVNLNFIKSIQKLNQRTFEVILKPSDSKLQISQRYAIKIKKIMGI